MEFTQLTVGVAGRHSERFAKRLEAAFSKRRWVCENNEDSRSLQGAHHRLGEADGQAHRCRTVCLVLKRGPTKGRGDPREEDGGAAWGEERKALCG